MLTVTHCTAILLCKITMLLILLLSIIIHGADATGKAGYLDFNKEPFSFQNLATVFQTLLCSVNVP